MSRKLVLGLAIAGRRDILEDCHGGLMRFLHKAGEAMKETALSISFLAQMVSYDGSLCSSAFNEIVSHSVLLWPM